MGVPNVCKRRPRRAYRTVIIDRIISTAPMTPHPHFSARSFLLSLAWGVGTFVQAQCFGTFPFPASTVLVDESGVPTTISPASFAGDYAVVSLIAGHSYRFNSTIATDFITISATATSGVLAFGSHPLRFTAATTQDHFVHFHTNSSCGTQNSVRLTTVARVHCIADITNCGGTNESIVRVTIGAINNITSSCGANGYSDLSTQVTGVFTGAPAPITVINANAYPGDQVRVFVDWDRDLDFAGTGEAFTLTTTDNLTFTGSITAPPGTTQGNVLMRVRLAFTGSVLPCGTSSFGEVEDYSLNVGTFGNGLFAGGTGRGDVRTSIIPTPVASAIYSGGSGRGDHLSAIIPAPVLTNIYRGGSGRGDVRASIIPTPVASAIYHGGIGRGDIMAAIATTPIFSNMYSGGVGRGDVMANVDPRRLVVQLKGFLQGPYKPNTGLMTDALRSLPTFPTQEPYSALGYAHAGGGGSEAIDPTVLFASGNNAIVDWVVVELRKANDPANVLATRSALLQRDGDVVEVDGVSPLTFNQASGAYHVALRHRNHLGAMTLGTVGLSTTPAFVDLSTAATATFGTNARNAVGGTFPAQALWSGDVNFDGVVRYTGFFNDRDPILQAIGGVVPTNTVSGYRAEDLDLNGTVRYTGQDNDRDLILQTIGGIVPTNSRMEQLP